MVKFVLNPVPPNMCFLTFFAEVTSFHSEVNFLGVYFIINLQFTLMKPARTYKNVQDSPQKGRSTRLHPAENEDKPGTNCSMFFQLWS